MKKIKTLIITGKIKKFLDKSKISQNELGRLIGLSSGALSTMMSGEKPFPEDRIQNLAPVLAVSPDTIKGWILADKYSRNILKLALEAKQKPLIPIKIPQQKTKPEKILILTTEIDKRIIEKGLSRTKLSDLIGCNQSELNKMITGTVPMSDPTIQKLAAFFEIPEDQIRAWIVADQYSLEALRVAVET